MKTRNTINEEWVAPRALASKYGIGEYYVLRTIIANDVETVSTKSGRLLVNAEHFAKAIAPMEEAEPKKEKEIVFVYVLADGTLVNKHGMPVDEEGNLLKQDDNGNYNDELIDAAKYAAEWQRACNQKRIKDENKRRTGKPISHPVPDWFHDF